MVMIFWSMLLILRERGIQRGGFARAGRTGHQHDAVRQLAARVEDLAVALRHAQVFHADTRIAAVEDTQHHRLAVDHRDDRDAQVDVAAGDLHADAAILGQALFGDVEMTTESSCATRWPRGYRRTSAGMLASCSMPSMR